MPSHLALVKPKSEFNPTREAPVTLKMKSGQPLMELAKKLITDLGLEFVMKSHRHLKVGPINFYSEKGTVHVDGRQAKEGAGIEVLRLVCQEIFG